MQCGLLEVTSLFVQRDEKASLAVSLNASLEKANDQIGLLEKQVTRAEQAWHVLQFDHAICGFVASADN